MSDVIPISSRKRTLSERFWSIARGMDSGRSEPDQVKPVAVVRHVLAVLDALERGEGQDGSLSINTVSFLKLLREHELRGDLSYASPEQIRGETMDERSLVFSVGVLLFERLTGRHPFGAEGNYPRRVARIRKGELGSGVNYFPTVPAGLRTVLMRAMGPFPEERWANLSELRARLEQFVDDESPAPRLPGTSADASDPHDGPTRIVRMASQFGKELMDVVDRHESTKIPRRKRSTRPPTPSAAPPRTPAKRVITPPAGVNTDPFAATIQVRAAPEVEPEREASVVIEQPMPALPQRAPSVGGKRRPVTPSPATVIAAAERAFTIPNLKPKRSSAASAAMWAVVGAAIASVIFYFFVQSGGGTTTDAPTAGVAGAVTQPSTSDDPGETEPDTRADPQAIEAADDADDADADADADADDAAETPVPAVFDPQVGGDRAAVAAAPCVSDKRLEHGVTFRVGLLFAAHTGTAAKAYFGRDDQLTAAEHLCMSKAFSAVIAGAAPAKGTVIDYRIHVSKTEKTAQIVKK